MITDQAKQQQFEKYVAELAETIHKKNGELRRATLDLQDAVLKLDIAQKHKKGCKADVVELEDELKEDYKAYFRITSEGWENWTPDLIERGEINEKTDNWNGNLPAREHFDLTDYQWDQLLKHCDTPVMSVGQLGDIIADLEAGRYKIKGFGPAFIEQIKDQFEMFWEKFKKLDKIWKEHGMDQHEVSFDDKTRTISIDLKKDDS